MGVYMDVNIGDCGSQRCQIPRAGVTRGCEPSDVHVGK